MSNLPVPIFGIFIRLLQSPVDITSVSDDKVIIVGIPDGYVVLGYVKPYSLHFSIALLSL
jgi:hypothetical protein